MNDNGSATNADNNAAYDPNLQPTVRPSSVTGAEHLDHLAHATRPKKHDHKAWLVYTSAVPTVLIFIVCLIIIAIRNRMEEK